MVVSKSGSPIKKSATAETVASIISATAAKSTTAPKSVASKSVTAMKAKPTSKAVTKTVVAKSPSVAKKMPPAAKVSAAKAPTAAKKSSPVRTGGVSSEQRAFMIAEAAYFMAEKRNFEGGYAWHDWLVAETEVDRMLGRRK